MRVGWCEDRCQVLFPGFACVIIAQSQEPERSTSQDSPTGVG
jgi:hypothetical protein